MFSNFFLVLLVMTIFTFIRSNSVYQIGITQRVTSNLFDLTQSVKKALYRLTSNFVSNKCFATFSGCRLPRRVSQCICLANLGHNNCSEVENLTFIQLSITRKFHNQYEYNLSKRKTLFVGWLILLWHLLHDGWSEVKVSLALKFFYDNLDPLFVTHIQQCDS